MAGSIEAYIRQAATARGINPDVAVRVARSEGGLVNPTQQSYVVKNGRRETSYGPFQLKIGGGLGDGALKAGVDPRKETDWQKGVDVALNYAARHGWGSWYGAAKAGVSNFAGISKASRPLAYSADTGASAAQQAAASMAGGQAGGVLRQGSRGPAVSQLQQQLAAAGLYRGKVDGSYGPQTAAAVRAAESTYGLNRDKGIAGPQVQAALAGTGATQDITSTFGLAPPGGPADMPGFDPVANGLGRAPGGYAPPPTDPGFMHDPPSYGQGISAPMPQPYGSVPPIAGGDALHAPISMSGGPPVMPGQFMGGEAGPTRVATQSVGPDASYPPDDVLTAMRGSPFNVGAGRMPQSGASGRGYIFGSPPPFNVGAGDMPQAFAGGLMRPTSPAGPVGDVGPLARIPTPNFADPNNARGIEKYIPPDAAPSAGPDFAAEFATPFQQPARPITPTPDWMQRQDDANAQFGNELVNGIGNFFGGSAPAAAKPNLYQSVPPAVPDSNRFTPTDITPFSPPGLQSSIGSFPQYAMTTEAQPMLNPDYSGPGYSGRVMDLNLAVPSMPGAGIEEGTRRPSISPASIGSYGSAGFSPVARDNPGTMFMNNQRDIPWNNLNALPDRFEEPGYQPFPSGARPAFITSADSSFLPGGAGPDHLASFGPAGGQPGVSIPLVRGDPGYVIGGPGPEGSMPFVLTPPRPASLDVSPAGSPQDRARQAISDAARAAGVNGAGGSGGNSGGGIVPSQSYGGSPGAYSYAGATPWGSSYYTTPSGGYSNSPFTPSGYTSPSFNSISGGPTYAYHPNGQGGGTFVTSDGRTMSY